MTELKNHLAKVLDTDIISLSPVSGGDISNAYKIKTKGNDYFLKANSSDFADAMFKAEVNGLEAIKKTNTIATPSVITTGNYHNIRYLLIEFIESKNPDKKDLSLFGNQLASLHTIKMPYYGFSSDNFIGSLPQSNQRHTNWVDFYSQERLIPQLNMGLKSKLLRYEEVPSESSINNTLDQLFKNVNPSLLHGDLWGGNYIISKDGTPYLLDPAVYYGHSEVDIAMSRLFGGFGDAFYETYFDNTGQNPGLDDRINIYQLYYLLVHLNIFGSSYYSRVIRLLKRYF